MRIVAITQRVDVFPERNEVRDALDQRLALFIAKCGGITAPVPNGLSAGDIAAWLATIGPAAIVLSGGNDIGERPERDSIERQILDYARNNDLPALGICRGMQMMAVWAGSSLRPVAGHVRTRHTLVGALAGQVNSYHGQALTACPPDFKTLATADVPEGDIEAIRHNDLRWEGWMWHPEREAEFDPRDIDRLRNLLA
jgi:gamma-glutamyl-gamma-aminobutyrate hydrolase PuuD